MHAGVAGVDVQYDASFVPPPWLRNAHVQSTLLSTTWWRYLVRQRARAVLAGATAATLDCGDGVRLNGWCSRQPAYADSQRWIVVLHGWLGSAASSYVLSLSAALYEQGYNIFRLNFRDHGDSHHLNAGIFHSCLLDEVSNAVRVVQQRYAAKHLSLAGFSLGGNFALRVAAQASHAGIDLQRVVAISPALNPHATDAALAIGPAMYRYYFLANWKRALRLKQQSFPEHYEFKTLLRSRSVTELTANLLRDYSSFNSLTEYYDGYSLLGSRLQTLNTPAHIVMALDDPIIPATDLTHLASNRYLQITATQYGGHCGFFDRLRSPRWIDRKVVEWLSQGEARLSPI